MDHAGWFVATLHSTIGHEATAAFLRQPVGDKDACLICAYERQPSDVSRQAVIRALAAAGEGTQS